MAKNAIRDPKALEKYKDKAKKAKDIGSPNDKRSNGFLKYCEDKFEDDFKENDNKIADFKNGRSHRAVRLEKSWRDYEKKSKYEKKAGKMPDPTPSKFRPDSNFGSVTDTIDKMIEGTQIFFSKSFKKKYFTIFFLKIVKVSHFINHLLFLLRFIKISNGYY